MTTGLCVLALCLLSADADPGPTPVHVVGNEVLPTEVYLSIIDSAGLCPTGPATPDKAQQLARAVQRFLRRSGYEIAQVEGIASNDDLVLNVDEGHVTRVVFRGLAEASTIQLRVKVTLSMPFNVFNRPHLTRQLEELREEFGFTHINIELGDTPAVSHHGPQLEEYPRVAGITVIPPPTKHELIVTFGERDWNTGFGFIIDLKPPDGVRVGLSYSGRHLIFDDDRYHLEASGGVTEFSSLEIPDDHTEWISFSRVKVAGEWISPPLFGTGLRPSLIGYYDLKGRQRRDIALQRFYWMQHGALANIGYSLDDWLLVSIGAGFEGRWLFDVEQADGLYDPETMPLVEPWSDAAGMVSLRTEVNFEPDTLRLDHEHELWVEARAYFKSGARPRWVVRAEYEKVFTLGWHELRLRVAGIGQWGQIRFLDEESLSFFLRGIFGTRHWVRRAVGSSTAFRFSITRDLFHLGVFYEQTVFEEPSRGNPPHRIMYANSMGPSLHFLLFDTMQANFYYSFGLDTDGVFEHGFSAGLIKAF